MSTPTRDGRHRRHRRDARRPDAHPSFVRRPSSPTTAGAHASHHTRPVPSRPRSVAARSREYDDGRKAACTNSILWTELYDESALQPTYVSFAHTPHTVPVCVQTRGHIGRSPRPRDPTTRRPDDRESATRGRRRRATCERGRRETMSGGLPYGLQSMLKVRETTRRDGRWNGMDGWMDARREGRAMDG